MSATLAVQQQALLAALWAPSLEDATNLIVAHAIPVRAGAGNDLKRGLQAYRAHGRLLAQRALAAAFPVVAQLVGEENFGALARAFWLANAPASGDIALWGFALPEFIEAAPQLADEPYLGDVARVEWALHRAATAGDAFPDPGSIALLGTHDPANLVLRLSPGAACVSSRWPVVSIVLAHQQGEPALEEAGQRLRAGTREVALVWRQGFKPQLRLAQRSEPAFVDAIHEGASLADALAAAPDIDFNAWLVSAFQSGLITGAAMFEACKKTGGIE